MSQKDLFPETLIGQTQSLVQDTHVSRSALQANKKGPKTLATSGPIYIKSLHSKDPLTVFLKMFLVTLRWDSTKFSLTWKMKNTPARRSIYQLTRLVQLTKENASGSSASLWATPRVGGEESFESAKKRLGEQRAKKHNLFAQVQHEQLWATPNTLDYLPQRSKEATLKMQNGHRKGRTKPSNLREQVDKETMKMWPTPDANMGERGTQPNWTKTRPSGHHAQYTLNQAARDNTKEWEKGSLNPNWVEWLMGYDRGWTDLDCANPQPHDGFIKEPEDIPRVAKGKKDRAKRLKGLGNAVLPQIPMQIALAIKETNEIK